MATAAKEFGLSAAGLADACRRNNIPIPPVGHWTKIEVGHKITPPLLMPDPAGRETVGIYVPQRLNPELAELAAETSPLLEIPKVLSHPLALKTEQLSASGKENERKLIVPKTGNASHFLVSRQQMPRALPILNARLWLLKGRATRFRGPRRTEQS